MVYVVEHYGLDWLPLLNTQIFKITCLFGSLVILHNYGFILSSLEAPNDRLLSDIILVDLPDVVLVYEAADQRVHRFIVLKLCGLDMHLLRSHKLGQLGVIKFLRNKPPAILLYGRSGLFDHRC